MLAKCLLHVKTFIFSRLCDGVSNDYEIDHIGIAVKNLDEAVNF